MDTFGSLLLDRLDYVHAYKLCEEMLVALIAAVVAMWGSILWMRKQDVKRQEHAIILLAKLIDKVEERTKGG